MELLPDFELIRPATIDEAVTAGARAEARYIAGGTALIPNLRRGVGAPSVMVDLTEIEELGSIDEIDGRLHIGAGVTLAQLISDPRLQVDYPLVAQVALGIAGETHRQSATVGGNLCLDTRCQFYNQSEWWRKANNYCLKYRGDICHVATNSATCKAAYAGELAPALMLQGAYVEIASPTGRRSIALEDMYQEDGADYLLLAPGELLVSINVGKLEGYNTAYRKVRVRGGIDYPLVGVAMATLGNVQGIEDIRIAMTGTNSRPLVLKGTEVLAGKPLDDAAIKVLDKLVRTQTKPMRSTLMPGPYRSKVVVNVTKRLARELL